HLDRAVIRLELGQLLVEGTERLAEPAEDLLHREFGESFDGLALGQLPIDIVRAEADQPALFPKGDVVAHGDGQPPLPAWYVKLASECRMIPGPIMWDHNG